MAESGERTRRIRTALSAILLLAGTVLLWIAMHETAIWLELTADGEVMLISGPRGWDWLLDMPMLLPGFAALALAAAPWIGAAWFRSVWCRWVGLLACASSAAVFVIALFAPTAGGSWSARMSRIGAADPEIGPGWRHCILAGILIAFAFVVLPSPVRPAPGEPRDPAIIRRARMRSACLAALFGTVALAYAATTPSPYVVQAAWTLCGLLYVFVGALFVRPLRFVGALAACAGIAAIPYHRSPGWWSAIGGTQLTLETVMWYAAPSAFLVAFLLLPRRRDARPAPA